MKRLTPLLFTAAIAATLAITQPGCTSTTTVDPSGVTNVVQKLDPVKVAAVVQGAVSVGLPFAIQKDTNTVPYLRLAASVIQLAAASGEYDPTQLQAAIDAISTKNIKDPEARALVRSAANAAAATYRIYFAEGVGMNPKFKEWAQPIMLAVSRGILSALPPAGVGQIPPTVETSDLALWAGSRQ